MTNFAMLLTVGALFNVLCSGSVPQDSGAAESSPVPVEAAADQSTKNEAPAGSEGAAVNPADVDPADVDASGNENAQSSAEAEKQSVVLELSSTTESNSEDGKGAEVKIRGKFVLIGPNGEKQEFDFNDSKAENLRPKLGESHKEVNSRKVVIIHDQSEDSKEAEQAQESTSEATWVEERFVIGIQCEEADELLRIHLRLGEKGVVILDVRDDTPAAAGGLKKHDIIVGIDDREIVSREDLTKAVLESEGKPLSLSIIRAGEPQSITVTPTKMKVPVVVASASADAEQIRVLTGSGKGGVRLQLVHPGIMLENGIPQDEKALRTMIEQFRKSVGEQAAIAHEQARNAKKQAEHLEGHTELRNEQLHESLKTLQQEMREVQKQLEELKKQIASPDSLR